MHHRHTLSVLVENKPGVLTRIAGMFARVVDAMSPWTAPMASRSAA